MNQATSTDRSSEVRRRQWDDDFVLKRQFSALIPAFDPRPGRTNVSQHQDVEIPEEGEQLNIYIMFLYFNVSED